MVIILDTQAAKGCEGTTTKGNGDRQQPQPYQWGAPSPRPPRRQERVSVFASSSKFIALRHGLHVTSWRRHRKIPSQGCREDGRDEADDAMLRLWRGVDALKTTPW